MDSIRVGFRSRLGAWLIDAIVVAVVAVVLGPMMAGLTDASVARATAEMAQNPGLANNQTAMGFASGIARWSAAASIVGLVYALLEGLTGRTLGKLLLGYRVGSAEGTRASLPRLLARFAAKASSYMLAVAATLTGVVKIQKLSEVVALILFAGCFLALGRAKQALHDRIARTAVYRSTDLASAPAPTPAV